MNIRLGFIASSFRTSMLYLYPLRTIIYILNNNALFVILMDDTQILNRFICFRCRSNLFLLLHFCKPVWIRNMCKIHKTFSFPSAARMRIFFLKLRHTKHWVIVWALIYKWNCDKSSFSKRGKLGMINVQEHEL